MTRAQRPSGSGLTGRTVLDLPQVNHERGDFLRAAGVPTGPNQNVRELLDEDPHAQAKATVSSPNHPADGDVPAPSFPVRTSGTPFEVWRPLLGEHTDNAWRSSAPGDGRSAV